MLKLRPPAASRRLRKLKRSFGMSAPRVVVRSHAPFRMPILFFLVWLLGLLIGYGGFHWWRLPNSEQLPSEELNIEYAACRAELFRLQTEAGTERQAAVMERATQQQILLKSEHLERENAQLREDLRTFEQLMLAPDGNASIRVENFRLTSESDGGYRYRLFLAYVPEKTIAEFRGRMVMHVTYALSGGEVELAIPEVAADELRVRRYLRREGTFRLPEGAKLLSGEVKILQGEVIKVKMLTQF